jgi:hypothetical protein
MSEITAGLSRNRHTRSSSYFIKIGRSKIYKQTAGFYAVGMLLWFYLWALGPVDLKGIICAAVRNKRCLRSQASLVTYGIRAAGRLAVEHGAHLLCKTLRGERFLQKGDMRFQYAVMNNYIIGVA